MEKLKSYIEKWIDGKQVKGIHLSPLDIYECIDVYNAMVRKEKITFINGNVHDILECCGIKTEVCGIGWGLIY